MVQSNRRGVTSFTEYDFDNVGVASFRWPKPDSSAPKAVSFDYSTVLISYHPKATKPGNPL